MTHNTLLTGIIASVTLCSVMDDMDQRIRIDDERGYVLLPLSNFLRLCLLRLTPLVNEFLKESNTSDVVSFLDWLKNKLGVKPNDKILL